MTSAEEMLLLARRAAEPSAETRARVGWALQAALLVPPSLPPPPPAAAAAATAGAKGAWLAAAAPFLSVGLIAASVGVVAARWIPAASERASNSLSPVRIGKPILDAAAPAAPLSSMENLPAGPREPTAAPSRKSRVFEAETPAAAPKDPLLFVVSGLQRAQTALRDGHPLQALVALNELDRDYPSSVLREERSAVRVHAQCAVSRSPASLAVAREFLGAHPTSLYGARIRKACDLE